MCGIVYACYVTYYVSLWVRSVLATMFLFVTLFLVRLINMFMNAGIAACGSNITLHCVLYFGVFDSKYLRTLSAIVAIKTFNSAVLVYILPMPYLLL